MLDVIQSDSSMFSLIKSPSQFLQIAKNGIKYAHPIVLDKSFFTMGIERWKNNQLIYLIYAKFIAIYPEETLTLKYIYKAVLMEKFKGSVARCIIDQAKVIMKLRESGSTSELRSKMNMIKKQSQLTRHKLCHVWDVVIRGNLNEIEESTKRAITAMNQTNADFKRILVEYPNNRNITYFYSIFLHDIIGDHTLSEQMYKRTKALQPGILVVDDQPHLFGLIMFPNLPNSIKIQREQILMSSTIDGGVQDSLELNSDKDIQNNLEQIAGIRNNIEELSIPSIKGSKIIRIVISLIFFIIPCISGLIYIDFYIDKLKKPLEFISSLSLLRSYAYQVIGFSLRYVGESLSILPKLEEDPDNLPKAFGYTWDTKKQLEYLLTVTTDALQDFGSFRMFEEDNYYINQSQNLIFQNTVPYDYYTSPTNVTTSMISIQAAIMDYTIQQKMILTGYDVTPSVLSSGTILNPIMNAYPITTNIHTAMQFMIDYISNNYTYAKYIGKILLISLIIIIVLVYVIALLIQLKWINSNKLETYQCLFSLPKKTVSELAENRRSKKNDKQAEEMNKQNENILKIFNSGGNSYDLISDYAIFLTGTIFIILISISCVALFVVLVQNLTKVVRNSAPHLHYLLASYSMMLSAVNWFHVILFESSGNPIPTVDFNFSYNQMVYVMERSRHYYHLISSGGPTASEVPFKGFIDGINKASNNDCNMSTQTMDQIMSFFKNKKLRKKMKSGFDSLTQIFKCSPVDMTFVLIEPIIIYSIVPFRKGLIEKINTKLSSYASIWRQLITPSYDLFFEPMHNEIIPTIVEELREIRNKYMMVISILLIISIFIEILLFIQIIFIENHIRSVLRLLLHCSPSIIFSSSKITRVLNGDFSTQQNDSLDHNSKFFDILFTSLPDAIMFANSDMIIQSANTQCERTFGNINFVGKSIKDFFMSDKFTGNVEALFTSVNSNPTEEISFKSDSGTDVILHATSMIACGKFVISCRDVTQSHNYNTLILSEKQNSDKLLSTILPPSLVSRVQEGEKNISFSVQSASILFSDIVSFTPWCGSLPAEKVMSTLNLLFKRLDSILDTKHTMTKIKCIGDCYMAAGGIFAEINQPALHAKEVVSFGLLSIKEVILIDDEIKQNLKIRVGVNTGGPIVAGVLGIGKPTFEIIGPAINRAQQMEQNGVPMMVHISIDVYELICGLNFKFCNRRTINCKNEKVETYLVEP